MSSWPYFSQIHSFSAPIGIAFFHASDATLFYDKAAKCMGCASSSDMDCLQGVPVKDVIDCTWSLDEMISQNGSSFISLQNHMLFQLAEPYAPVVGTELIPENIYGLFKSGRVKPNLKMVINFASHEGETFIEPVFYPFGYDNRNEQRKSRVPRFLADRILKFAYSQGDDNRDWQRIKESVGS